MRSADRGAGLRRLAQIAGRRVGGIGGRRQSRGGSWRAWGHLIHGPAEGELVRFGGPREAADALRTNCRAEARISSVAGGLKLMQRLDASAQRSSITRRPSVSDRRNEAYSAGSRWPSRDDLCGLKEWRELSEALSREFDPCRMHRSNSPRLEIMVMRKRNSWGLVDRASDRREPRAMTLEIEDWRFLIRHPPVDCEAFGNIQTGAGRAARDRRLAQSAHTAAGSYRRRPARSSTAEAHR